MQEEREYLTEEEKTRNCIRNCEKKDAEKEIVLKRIWKNENST